jgi:hypothetical protein
VWRARSHARTGAATASPGEPLVRPGSAMMRRGGPDGDPFPGQRPRWCPSRHRGRCLSPQGSTSRRRPRGPCPLGLPLKRQGDKAAGG